MSEVRIDMADTLKRRNSSEIERPDLTAEESSTDMQYFQKEMKEIEEFFPKFTDKMKEIEIAVDELEQIAADIEKDSDALVGEVPAPRVINRGTLTISAGAACILVGAGLAAFTGGVSMIVGVLFLAGTGSFSHGVYSVYTGVSALGAYDKKIEEICNRTKSCLTELDKSAYRAIEAYLKIGSQDQDYKKAELFLKLSMKINEFNSLLSSFINVANVRLAVSMFTRKLNEVLSLLVIVLTLKVEEEKRQKATNISEYTATVKDNLQAVKAIFTEMKTAFQAGPDH